MGWRHRRWSSRLQRLPGARPRNRGPESGGHARGPRDRSRQLLRDGRSGRLRQRGAARPRHGGPSQEDRGKPGLPNEYGQARVPHRGAVAGGLSPRPHRYASSPDREGRALPSYDVARRTQPTRGVAPRDRTSVGPTRDDAGARPLGGRGHGLRKRLRRQADGVRSTRAHSRARRRQAPVRPGRAARLRHRQRGLRDGLRRRLPRHVARLDALHARLRRVPPRPRGARTLGARRFALLAHRRRR